MEVSKDEKDWVWPWNPLVNNCGRFTVKESGILMVKS